MKMDEKAVSLKIIDDLDNAFDEQGITEGIRAIVLKVCNDNNLSSYYVDSYNPLYTIIRGSISETIDCVTAQSVITHRCTHSRKEN